MFEWALGLALGFGLAFGSAWTFGLAFELGLVFGFGLKISLHHTKYFCLVSLSKCAHTRVVGVEAVVRVEAVVFDLDGVLVDSETVWDEVRRSFAARHGGTWLATSTRDMQGMSTPEWASYLVSDVGVRLSPDEVTRGVVAEMAARYEAGPPVLPGAVAVVREVAARYPVAIASSSPPVLIRSFLEATDLVDVVPVALSSEEAGAGKPAPDVYLLAASKLGANPTRCAAVEDSTNGLRSALAAGMTVYAVPNPHFPPDPKVLAEVTVLRTLSDLPSALSAD